MIEYTVKIILSETETINVDSSNLINISFSQSDRADFNLPSWGIYSNVGNLTFKDKTGAISAYADKGLLKKGVEINFYINDQQIGQYFAADWQYSNETQEVFLQCKDGLEEWQDIVLSPINFDPANQEDVSFAEIYKKLRVLTPIKYSVALFDVLEEKTQEYLSSAYTKYWFLKEKTLWNAWQNFAVATKCHIYKDKGIVLCLYNGGN